MTPGFGCEMVLTKCLTLGDTQKTPFLPLSDEPGSPEEQALAGGKEGPGAAQSWFLETSAAGPDIAALTCPLLKGSADLLVANVGWGMGRGFWKPP